MIVPVPVPVYYDPEAFSGSSLVESYTEFVYRIQAGIAEFSAHFLTLIGSSF